MEIVVHTMEYRGAPAEGGCGPWGVLKDGRNGSGQPEYVGIPVNGGSGRTECPGGQTGSGLRLRNYEDKDFEAYRNMYNDCFREMRIALERTPVECCQSAEKLKEQSRDIFVLEKDGRILGSVAVYGNEIDDLIVDKREQGNGYGKALLRAALEIMESRKLAPVRLHVADWNQRALGMYRKMGFEVVKTEVVS